MGWSRAFSEANQARAGALLASAATMRIARELYDEIVAHARADAPNECCGMIATRDGEAVKIYPAVNAAASPLRYEIDGAEQYRIQMAIDDAGLDLGAIYHSHTRSDPYPSQTDINLAFYPDSVYLIVGVAKDHAEVRAFEIRDGQVSEVELRVN
jgi:proteasome lid subunit RPN8/RPN11